MTTNSPHSGSPGAIRCAIAGMAATALLVGMVLAGGATAAGAAGPAHAGWANKARPHFLHPKDITGDKKFLAPGGRVQRSVPSGRRHGAALSTTASTGYVKGGIAKLAATPKVIPTGTTFVVNTTSDLALAQPTLTTCTDTATTCSLRAAIGAADNLGNATPPTPVTIDLPAGTFTLTKTLNEVDDLYVSNPDGVTINGAGQGTTTIAGTGHYPVLGIGEELETGTPAVVDHLTITGGHATYTSFYGCGGGIWAEGDGDLLELTHVTLSGNSAERGGGGLCADGQVYATDSTISGNTVKPETDSYSTFGGGAVLGWDGYSAARFQGDTIDGNTLDTSDNTTCYLYTTTPITTINPTTEARHGVKGHVETTCTTRDWFAGGAGLTTMYGSQLTIASSSVDRNTLTAGAAKCEQTNYTTYCGFLAGGGLLNLEANLTATDDSFSTNSVDQTAQCYEDCYYGALGGGVANFGGARFTGDTINTNRAIGGTATTKAKNTAEGGGLDTFNPTVVTNSTIDGNSATGTLTNLSASTGGGGVFAGSPGFVMTGTNVSNNTVTNGAVAGVVVWSPDAYITGGPPVTTRPDVKSQRNDGHYISGDILRDDVVDNNSASTTYSYVDDEELAEYGSGGGVYVEDGSVTISGLTIDGNSAAIWAGGLWVSTDTRARVTGTTVGDNTAYSGGGVMLTYDALLTMQNSTVAGNSSTGTTFNFPCATDKSQTCLGKSGVVIEHRTGSGPAGGGIYDSDDSLVSLSYDTISGNSSATTGGGIYQGRATNTCSTCYSQGYSTSVGTIIAANTAAGHEQDCASTTTFFLTDGGWNLSGDNSCAFVSPTDQTTVTPRLSTLGTHAGGIPTMVPYIGSPAIDMGGGPACPATDERGVARPQGAKCDVGAVEVPGGYYLASATGAVYAFGGAPFYGSAANGYPTGYPIASPVVGIAEDPLGNGYWLAESNGAVLPFGAAGTYGNMARTALNAPIVGIASTHDGNGYYLVGADGGVYAFGDAAFHGSATGLHLNQPIVAISVTPTGKGYTLVAADGGVFCYTSPYHGSMGGSPLNKPMVGIASSSTGKGYWTVASDGGIFTFPSPTLPFYGSLGAITLNAPIVGMLPAPNPGGYWLAAKDGGVFAFGAATYATKGSLPALGISTLQVVGIAAA